MLQQNIHTNYFFLDPNREVTLEIPLTLSLMLIPLTLSKMPPCPLLEDVDVVEDSFADAPAD